MSLQPIDFYDADKWSIQEDRELEDREVKSISLIREKMVREKDIRILDVGCGNGFFLGRLKESLNSKSVHYSGVDYSKYVIRKAKRAHPDMDFKTCNLEESIPLASESFDVVFCGEVIEHIYNPDYAIEECARVLKPGGILVLTTPNLNTWYNRILFMLGIQPIFYETSLKSAKNGAGPLKRLKGQDVPVGHIRLFNRAALSDIVTSAGLDVIEFRGAIFHALPAPVQAIDKLFTIRPNLASNLIVVARKA
jgi:SAM-dependent methyltransferase